jgi:hypothetical protein
VRALSASELLSAWEQGVGRSAARRAFLLLAAAFPEIPPEALGQLSIGRRDARLLTLREYTFGPQLAGIAGCPACAERLELNFNIAEVRMDTSDEEIAPLSLDLDGYQLRFRVPNSFDLIAISENLDLGAPDRHLLQRCILSANYHGEAVAAEQLPVEVTDAMAAQMAEADPQADVRLQLACVRCDHRWQTTFDVLNFFWNEIHAWAERLLREVHMLARAYGWREADILAMSPWRRQRYLGMIGA